MRDLGILLLRLGLGSLMMGHGVQKLFGWAGGHGVAGTGKHFEQLGLTPGPAWASLAGVSELAGGALTALGLANPVGPMALVGAMAMAGQKAHAGKPIWNTAGGPELPLTNAIIGVALMLTGPGMFSLDRVLGVRVPATGVTVATMAGTALLLGGLIQNPAPEPAPATS